MISSIKYLYSLFYGNIYSFFPNVASLCHFYNRYFIIYFSCISSLFQGNIKNIFVSSIRGIYSNIGNKFCPLNKNRGNVNTTGNRIDHLSHKIICIKFVLFKLVSGKYNSYVFRFILMILLSVLSFYPARIYGLKKF